jgi:hypothetical protein
MNKIQMLVDRQVKAFEQNFPKQSYTDDKILTHDHCYICGETRTTAGCGCDRIQANKEAMEVYREVMNDNGMISADYRGYRS